MNKDMMNPRKLDEAEVRLLVLDMVPKIPPELTLEASMFMLIEAISDMSERITMHQTSNLVGIAAIITKAIAADQEAAARPIVVDKETRQ